MKTAAIIQARMGSTRLPGKVLMEINGQPVLKRLIDRVKVSQSIDQVIVATGFDFKNDSLRRWCFHNEIDVYSGPEDDVLQRVLLCAQYYHVDRIVDITGDCPLIDYRHIDAICRAMKEYTTIDYGSNIFPRTWPDGFDVQVYSTELLERIHEKLKDDNPVREHAGINIMQLKDVSMFNHNPPSYTYHHPSWGLTLDEEDDLTLIRKIFTNFDQGDWFSAIDVIDFLHANMHLLNINSHVERKGVMK